MARHFAELRFIRRAFASKAEFVIVDGALYAAYPKEMGEVSTIYDEAKAAGTTGGGLSKSTTIFTEEGLPVAGYLDRLADRRGLGKWVARIGRSREWAYRATVYYAKLHEGAEAAFRLDSSRMPARRGSEGCSMRCRRTRSMPTSRGTPSPSSMRTRTQRSAKYEVKSIKDQILDRLRPG